MTKSTGVGRGGARANSGRKSLDGAGALVAEMTVYLDQECFDIVESYGGGTVGVRMALRALIRLQSTAKENASYHGITKKRAAVSTTLPIPPKLVIPSELREDGTTYNFMAHARMVAKAKEEHERAMVKYRAACAQLK